MFRGFWDFGSLLSEFWDGLSAALEASGSSRGSVETLGFQRLYLDSISCRQAEGERDEGKQSRFVFFFFFFFFFPVL